MKIKLRSYKLLFRLLDLLSNSKWLHNLVVNKKVYLGASIISLSLANHSCTSDNNTSKDKTPDKKDSITKKPVSDSLIENNEIKKDSSIRLINNKHKVLNKPTIDTIIEIVSCYDISIEKPLEIPIENTKDDEFKIYTFAEEMPQFIGGDDSLKKYISTNLVWPPEAKENEIMGTVYVDFVVEINGTLTDISIKRGIYHTLDNEAIRLVKNMPKWNPGKQNGKEVRVRFVVPIRFKHQ